MNASIYNEMMATRPCCFCLCLKDGSVFADFETDESKLISLLRISFDGFGCCSVQGKTTKMSLNDSSLLLSAVASKQLDAPFIDDILRRYFRSNLDVIWGDALTDHELL